MTELHLQNHNTRPVLVVVTVPTCPMFDFANQNDTPEVRAWIAKGYRITGHVD